MITTSNFWRSGSRATAVVISKQVPDFFTGRRYTPLTPTWGMLNRYRALAKTDKAAANEQFNREYRELLAALDPTDVLDDLGPEAILVCWEHDPSNPETPCHRRLVAEWLHETTGTEVPELSSHPRPASEASPQLELPLEPVTAEKPDKNLQGARKAIKKLRRSLGMDFELVNGTVYALSESGNRYPLDLNEPYCECPDFQYRCAYAGGNGGRVAQVCKHIRCARERALQQIEQTRRSA